MIYDLRNEMPDRSSQFHTREPFENDDSLAERQSHTAGPFRFLNPTRALFRHETSDATDKNHISYHWRSRNNRKGRHALVLTPSTDAASSIITPPRTNDPRQILKGIWRMFTVFPVYDISYQVATTFTLGSVLWVFNAFFVFLPLLRPSSTFTNEILDGGGITAFIGATIFEIGSIFLMLEAVNEHKEGCFGWAIEQAMSQDFEGAHEKGTTKAMTVRPGECSHDHVKKHNLVSNAESTDSKKSGKSWIWFPSINLLRTHYVHELGFLACAAQLFGATIFWIAGFTALPGIYNTMSHPLIDGVYWTPQVVGGSGFIVSGTLFMLETQKRWYIPALGTLGWHIGLWNLIGGVGFTLSPAFGYSTASWAQYQAACSTFWGSWAFIIGSVIQWYESLDKYPVEVKEL